MKLPVINKSMIVIISIVAVILLLAIYMPKYIKADNEYKAGTTAEAKREFKTAMIHYENAYKLRPNSTKIMTRLINTYYVNQKGKEAVAVYKRINGKRTNRRNMLELAALEKKIMAIYISSEQLNKITELYGKEELEATEAKLKTYLQKNTDDVAALFYFASVKYDLEKYQDSISLYKKVIELQPDFYSAYLNQAAAYRKIYAYGRADEMCKVVLTANVESTQAICSMIITELARGQLIKALEIAKKAYENDSSDMELEAVLCMAYHSNGDNAESLRLLADLKIKKYFDYNNLQAVVEGELFPF